jgi:hypothetical protein
MAALPPVDLKLPVQERVTAAVPYVAAHGVRSTAKHFHIDKSTLHRAHSKAKMGLPLFGKVGRPLALGGVVEDAIVQFFVDCANANLPQPRANLKQIAIAVAAGIGVDNFSAGKDWRRSFLERHNEDLEPRSPRPFPNKRNTALTMETLDEWMDFVQNNVYLKYFGTTDVDPRRIFNMDESPFKMGLEALGEAVKVLAAKRGEDPRSILGNFQETFTGIAYVCADGSRPLDAFVTRSGTLNSRVFRAARKACSSTKAVFAASEKVRRIAGCHQTEVSIQKLKGLVRGCCYRDPPPEPSSTPSWTSSFRRSLQTWNAPRRSRSSCSLTTTGPTSQLRTS